MALTMTGSAEAGKAPDGFMIFSREIVRPPAKKNLPPITRVAVFDFKGELGRAAANQLIDTLQAEPNEFDILDRQEMALTQGEMRLVDAGIVDPSQAASLGKNKGAQAVVVGSCDSFSASVRTEQRKIEDGIGKTLIKGLTKTSSGPEYKNVWVCTGTVNITIKLVGVESGSILATASNSSEPQKIEFDSNPGETYREELLAKLLGSTTKEFVSKISRHRVTLDLRFHKDAGEDATKAIINALNQDRPEKALIKAQENLDALKAQKADYKKIAAATFNLAAVNEANGNFEEALRLTYEANDMFDDHPKDLPHTYIDAAERLKRAVRLEQDKQD